jgi:hypothetical protein
MARLWSIYCLLVIKPQDMQKEAQFSVSFDEMQASDLFSSVEGSTHAGLLW